MNKKRIAICLFFIICLVSTSVFATVQASLSISVSTTQIKPKDEITVVLNVKDISGTTNGFRSFDGYIEYNKNVFETVKNTDLSINGGSGEFNQETGKFAVDLSDAVLEDSSLIAVKLVVKSNAAVGKVEDAVVFKDIKLATGLDGSITLSESLDITITANSTNDDNNSENDNNANDNTNTDNDNNANDDTNTDNDNNANDNANKDNDNTSNGNTNKDNNANANNQNQSNDNTTAPTPLPHTGVIKFGIIGIVIISIAVICYKKYKKIEI